ncbi:MAG TPA: hypothetical protein VF632_21810 [Longimicrobium sp.]|jgi:hypothetical protein
MGRIVHYVDRRGNPFPAIVRVTYSGDSELVDLTAFTDRGTAEAGVRVRRCDEHKDNTWHWPERES